MIKVLSIVGARPQFIKAATLSRAIRDHNRSSPPIPITELLVHTGQHYDPNMSDIFFDELEIPKPSHHLGIGSASHGRQTGEMLAKIEEVIIEEKPDWVLVYGDTNSTLAGALAAVKLHVPVAHIEAGLRSYNRRMPEEINRVLTDHVSSLLLCPTETAVRNLKDEGIREGVHLVGDVMFDAILHDIEVAEKKSTILRDLDLQTKGYFLATVHRAENTDDPHRFECILTALQEIALTHPVVWPVHPRARKILQHGYPHLLAEASYNGSPRLAKLTERGSRLCILEPVSYLDMLVLEKNARVVLTDSGGVQKEAYWLQVPCVTLRDETEWVETVETGWNVLAGAEPGTIVTMAQNPPRPSASPLLFGAGDAAKRIIEVLIAASLSHPLKQCPTLSERTEKVSSNPANEANTLHLSSS